MFAKLHLLSQDVPEGGGGLRWRAHPYLRVTGAIPKGPAVFEWSARQRADLEALWRDPSAEGARERLAGDLAAFCDKLGWAPDGELLEDAEVHGDEYLLTVSAVPPELYVLPWEVIQVGATGTYLSDYASAQVRYAMPGLEPREVAGAPPAPGVLFAWSAAGGAVPHEEQAAAIRAAAEAGGVAFRELAEVDEGKLQAALDAGPPSVLHLLCHGLPGPEGEPPRIKWGASDGPSEITATRLARMLRRHAGAIRLVVLSACGSGDGRGDPMFMGSLAQELHRKGIPNVVASRYPLSVRGSRVMTRALYDKMLREAWSLERALRHTRQALFRVDEGGESHPGDAYGIQLYAYDTERFVSDNQVEAERPVLSSYPFGTAARPVPKSGPPAAELTLELGEEPAGGDEELVGKLRRVAEDEGLTIATTAATAATTAAAAGGGARSMIVRTTVDGAQLLLGAWRSKVLQTAVGVIVGGLVLTQGILPALAATSAGGMGAAAGGKAAAAGGKAATGKAVAGAAGKSTAAAVTGKSTVAAAVAGKAVATKIVVAAAVGGLAVGSGAIVYKTQTEPKAPGSAARVAQVAPEPAMPKPVRPAAPPLEPKPEPEPEPERVEPPPPEPPPAPERKASPAGPAPRVAPRRAAVAPPPAPVSDSVSKKVSDKAVDSPTPPEPPKDPCKEPGAACETAPAPASPSQPQQPQQPQPQPQPQPPKVHQITPQVLTSLRASGETEIQPPRDVVNEMRRNGEAKTSAVAKLCLAADGSISSVSVVRSTKYPRYDEAILAAMRRWTHRPYVTNGAAAPACGLVTFVYSM